METALPEVVRLSAEDLFEKESVRPVDVVKATDNGGTLCVSVPVTKVRERGLSVGDRVAVYEHRGSDSLVYKPVDDLVGHDDSGR